MNDIVTQFNNEWAQQRPDLDVRPMLVMGRIMFLSKILDSAATQSLKPFDLRFSELNVLASLRRVGKPYQLTPKQLLEFVVLTSGSMTACLDRLEKRELIKRSIDPQDKRGRLVMLTNKGLKLIDEAIGVWFAKVKTMTQGLSKSEEKDLGRLLEKLLSINT
ncbi:MarR family winged helix-turn-helix transcriptional regulator [Aliikangiella sp. IMCC44632]